MVLLGTAQASLIRAYRLGKLRRAVFANVMAQARRSCNSSEDWRPLIETFRNYQLKFSFSLQNIQIVVDLADAWREFHKSIEREGR